MKRNRALNLHNIRKNIFKSLFLLFLFGNIVFHSKAGDYFLSIDDEAPPGCKFSKGCLNTCRLDDFIQEIRRHVIDGKDFEICAVKLAFTRCTIGPPQQSQANALFYREIVTILAEPQLKKEKEMISFICCFRFKAMRKALEQELQSKNHIPNVRNRLEKVKELLSTS